MSFQLCPVDHVFVNPVFGGLQSRELHARLPTKIPSIPLSNISTSSTRYYMPHADKLPSRQRCLPENNRTRDSRVYNRRGV